MKPFLAVVIWDDAWSSGIESLSLEDIRKKHKASVMQSLGWICESDEKGISLASERCLDEGEECYRGHTFIVRSLVRSVTPFKLSIPRKARHAPNPAVLPVGPPDPSAP
jgi:hypothetical protein